MLKLSRRPWEMTKSNGNKMTADWAKPVGGQWLPGYVITEVDL